MKKTSIALMATALTALFLLEGCNSIRSRLPSLSRDSQETTLQQDPYPSLSRVPSAAASTANQQLNRIEQGLSTAGAQVSAIGNQVASAPMPNVASPTMPTVPNSPINTSQIPSAGSSQSLENRLAAARAQYSNAGNSLATQTQALQAPNATLRPPTATLPTQPSNFTPSTNVANSIGSNGITNGLPTANSIVTPAAINRPQQTASLSPTPSAPETASGSANGELAVIYFKNGSSNLTRRDQLILRDIARILQQRGGRLGLVGHSSKDGKTAEAVNVKMSEKRAAVVARFLIDQFGVPRDRILARAVGTSRQVAGGADYNRRVQVILLPPA